MRIEPGTRAIVTGASAGSGARRRSALAARGAQRRAASRAAREDARRARRRARRRRDPGCRPTSPTATAIEARGRGVRRARPAASSCWSPTPASPTTPRSPTSRSRTPSRWSRVNVLGTLYTVHAALRPMLDRAPRPHRRRLLGRRRCAPSPGPRSTAPPRPPTGASPRRSATSSPGTGVAHHRLPRRGRRPTCTPTSASALPDWRSNDERAAARRSSPRRSLDGGRGGPARGPRAARRCGCSA